MPDQMETTILSDASQVDIYRVGWLHTLWYAARIFRTRPRGAREAWRNIWAQVRCDAHYVRHRRWHSLKSSFNGYLAEPYHWPADGALRRCGSGWTKARAMRSLRRQGWSSQ
jgi:hypothetical protein